MRRWPERVEGMTTSKRAQRRKPETDQDGSEATTQRYSGGQSVHREVEFEGHEEKDRAVIEGATPKMNWSAKGGTGRACNREAKALLIHPPHQGACGRHGTEEQCVTSGGLAESPGGTGVSGPISESEVASEALSVVGRLNITYEAW